MRGPKHGMARSVAVFGSLGFERDPEALDDLLGRVEMLRRLAEADGVPLNDRPVDLAGLDRAIDAWCRDPEVAAGLGNEVGLFLGRVLVRNISGAQGRVWGNGHPVVRLSSGRELDVVALAHDRVAHGQPRLSSVYAEALAHDQQ